MQSIIGTLMLSSFVSQSLREHQAIQFLLLNSTREYGDILEEVSESMLQPGDIFLFPFNSSSARYSGSFKHVAIYCGDREVIHFQNTSTSGTSGEISKEGFRPMKNRRGKCQVYRKKGGIDLKDFYSKVREVMNCEAKYYLGTNNCIHFALYLLVLVDFYMELVEIIDKDGSCSGGARSSHMV